MPPPRRRSIANMKRLKSILGVTVLFIAAVAVALVFAGQSRVLAHAGQKAAPATTADSRHPVEPAKRTVVVGGSLNGDLRPAEEPWRNWLR
jgi:hypothetical protein